MQFNLNIDRYSAALLPIEQTPPSAAPDRTRESASFDRHLEQAQRQPADHDRRPTADDAAQSSANEAPPRPKDRPAESKAEEASPQKRADAPSDDGSDSKESGDPKAKSPSTDSAAGEPTAGESKPTKKNLDKHKASDADEAAAEQLAIAAVAAQSADVATQTGETVSDQPAADEAVVLSKQRVDKGAALKQPRSAKAVAGNAAVETGIAPTDTLPSNDASPTATTKAASAAGPDASLEVARREVAPTAAADARAEASPDAKSQEASLPNAAIAATDALPAQGVAVAAEAKKGDESATTASTDVEDSAASELTENTPEPRRPRAAKASEGERHTAGEGNRQSADSLVNPADEAPADVVAATSDQPLREAAAPLADRTADQVGDRGGPRDASPAPASNSSTSGSLTDTTLNPPEKLASTLSSRMASGGTEKGAAATDSERVRFVQRVAKAFQSAADRGGPVRLRLSPPELGSLRLEITVRNGAMTARLEAETPAARTLLLDGLPALRERLAQQDIKVERFDVDLMDQSPNDSPQTRDGAANSHENTAAPPRKRIAAATVAAPAIAPVASSGHGDGRLNVLI